MLGKFNLTSKLFSSPVSFSHRPCVRESIRFAQGQSRSRSRYGHTRFIVLLELWANCRAQSRSLFTSLFSIKPDIAQTSHEHSIPEEESQIHPLDSSVSRFAALRSGHTGDLHCMPLIAARIRPYDFLGIFPIGCTIRMQSIWYAGLERASGIQAQVP